jgi:membrane-associated protein
MEYIQLAIDFVLHLDSYLTLIINWAGIWTYLVLFVVIFIETGLVVTPFLPGDSLLFAAGAIAALGTLNPWLMYFLLVAAAILGDTANYWIGHFLGERVYSSNSRFIKKEYLERTQRFYEKHGGKTIFLARFVPIIRTFAPFVAGIGRMRYAYFLSYNVIGGILWPAIFISAGYFFGNVPFIKDNFSLVVLLIIFLSILPPIIEWLKSRKAHPSITPSNS